CKQMAHAADEAVEVVDVIEGIGAGDHLGGAETDVQLACDGEPEILSHHLDSRPPNSGNEVLCRIDADHAQSALGTGNQQHPLVPSDVHQVVLGRQVFALQQIGQ